MVTAKTIFFSLSLVMVLVMSMLIIEYYFFKQEFEQFQQLKNDYSFYMCLIKKQLNVYDTKQRSPQLLTSSVPVSPNMSEFLCVNRDHDYLKQSAIMLAGKHNLEQAMAKLYKADSWAHSILGQNEGDGKTVQNTKKKKSHEAKIVKTSLRPKSEAIFIWPLERSQFWLSSLFGPRKNPDGSWGFHKGIDMAALRGTPVRAAGTGTVVKARFIKGYGKTVWIAHDYKFQTCYAHLDKIEVREGQKVKQADYIGNVGSTGHVRKSKNGIDASHLHFEVCVFGKHVNPFYFLA